ncbi:DUF2059 domain-containing protein [Sagittula sp. M10.9X]|uniref:DUF2059 domain-containing protein n=2 Tax=Sagittula salina TaxID=2820268 RepID=A0A940MNE5_9RHOB|nr:DUF2059 domain-containing protein [Sagittula salina]
MVLGFGLLLLALAPATPARAEAVDDMMEALQIDEILEIMHQEGLSYGADLANDMFPGGHNDRWGAILKEIYDPEKMRIVMRGHFADVLGQTDMHRLTAFFGSDLGTRIVQLELSARRALIDDDMEAAAREAFRVADPEAPRMRQLTRFVEVGDLLEANVTGALNASFKFYSGLVDGGALQMSEGDILSDVWGQEEETRVDTEEWLHAFLMLAYEPLSDEELEQYIDVSATPEGRVLNRALFAGFNAMYDEISYALGLAAAEQMRTQDL